MGKSYKRRVSNYLLDKRFQIKYTLFVLVISLAIFGVLGWLYYSEVKATTELMEVDDRFEQVLQQEGLDLALDDEYAQEFDQDMRLEAESRDTKTSIVLFIAVGMLVLFLAVGGIYMTHKMVGPLYALARFMNAAQQGNWKGIRTFRKGDEFAHLAEQFQKLARSIKVRHEEELVILEKMAAAHAKGDLDAVKDELAAVIADKKEYLDS